MSHPEQPTPSPNLSPSFEGWDSGFDAEEFVRAHAGELLREFGAPRLEETAFPVYTNGLVAARWLGMERVRVAERLSRRVGPVQVAVDFGSGLGVSLPGLAGRAQHVWAVELDADITRFMATRLALRNVTVVESIDDVPEPVDLMLALDVFEHVPDLATMVEQLADHTRAGGSWVVSGPTENRLYRFMRKVARTSGEGHVRGIDRVEQIVSGHLQLADLARLPFNTVSAASLFDVALFQKPMPA